MAAAGVDVVGSTTPKRWSWIPRTPSKKAATKNKLHKKKPPVDPLSIPPPPPPPPRGWSYTRPHGRKNSSSGPGNKSEDLSWSETPTPTTYRYVTDIEKHVPPDDEKTRESWDCDTPVEQPSRDASPLKHTAPTKTTTSSSSSSDAAAVAVVQPEPTWQRRTYSKTPVTAIGQLERKGGHRATRSDPTPMTTASSSSSSVAAEDATEARSPSRDDGASALADAYVALISDIHELYRNGSPEQRRSSPTPSLLSCPHAAAVRPLRKVKGSGDLRRRSAATGSTSTPTGSTSTPSEAGSDEGSGASTLVSSRGGGDGGRTTRHGGSDASGDEAASPKRAAASATTTTTTRSTTQRRFPLSSTPRGSKSGRSGPGHGSAGARLPRATSPPHATPLSGADPAGMQLCLDLLVDQLADEFRRRRLAHHEPSAASAIHASPRQPQAKGSGADDNDDPRPQHVSTVGEESLEADPRLQLLLLIKSYERLQARCRRELASGEVRGTQRERWLEAAAQVLDHWLAGLEALYERGLAVSLPC